MASEIYEILQAAGKDEAAQAEADAASCRRKAQFFLGSNNKRAKTVVLHIDGLDDSVSVDNVHTEIKTVYVVRAHLSCSHLMIYKNLFLAHHVCCCHHHSVVSAS